MDSGDAAPPDVRLIPPEKLENYQQGPALPAATWQVNANHLIRTFLEEKKNGADQRVADFDNATKALAKARKQIPAPSDLLNAQQFKAALLAKEGAPNPIINNRYKKAFEAHEFDRCADLIKKWIPTPN